MHKKASKPAHYGLRDTVTSTGAQEIIEQLAKMGSIVVDAEAIYQRATDRWIYRVELRNQRVCRQAGDS